MLKKILILLWLFFLMLIPSNVANASMREQCTIEKGFIACLQEIPNIFNPLKWWDMKVNWWAKEFVEEIILRISAFLFVIAVWVIAYWCIIIVASNWEEEEIKKWKDIIKWTLIWFLWLVSAA